MNSNQIGVKDKLAMAICRFQCIFSKKIIAYASWRMNNKCQTGKKCAKKLTIPNANCHTVSKNQNK